MCLEGGGGGGGGGWGVILGTCALRQPDPPGLGFDPATLQS